MKIHIPTNVISHSEYRRYTFAEKCVYRSEFGQKILCALREVYPLPRSSHVVISIGGSVRPEVAYLSPIFSHLRKECIGDDSEILLKNFKGFGIQIEL